MFSFVKYPSIENSYRSKTLKQINLHGFDTGEWVVLLKVHGANFSIWTDGETIKRGRRKSFIDENESFCQSDKIIDELRDNIINAFDHLKDDTKNNNEIVFWGEIAGGDYPHPDVKKPLNTSKVQKGVYYAPFIFFYMFDISVNGFFLPHHLVEEIGHTFGIVTADPLFRGSFEDCIQYSNKFEDPLHKYFGLPSIEDNVCEGIVIKPDDNKFFGNGSRCILKNKNDKFCENNSQKKHTPKEEYVWSVKGSKLYSLVSTYISENRLRNVLSHGLDIGQKDFGILMKELNLDVFDDFYKDHGDDYDTLDDIEKKKIRKGISSMCANLIRPNFQNIVDGEF